MDDQFRVTDEFQKLQMHMRECRFLGQALTREAMDLNRTFVDVPLGIQVLVKSSSGQAAIEQFHAANLNDAVLLLNLQSGGLGIENDLAHPKSYRAASMRSM